MTIIPIRWEICRMLVRWCFPENFLVSIFSIYLGFAVPHLGQSHISSHILFHSLIVVKVTMASPWRHDVGCEGESSEFFLYFRLVNYNIPAKWRWFFSLFINRTTVQFFWETTTFSVWMNIFGWWFTLHESFENGSKWTIPPKNWTVSDPKETSRVQNSAPNQRSPKPYEPRSKLPAIDFSIRWNLFLKKLNGVTRTQAFHKLRASSCTCKLRASPKSRR